MLGHSTLLVPSQKFLPQLSADDDGRLEPHPTELQAAPVDFNLTKRSCACCRQVARNKMQPCRSSTKNSPLTKNKTRKKTPLEQVIPNQSFTREIFPRHASGAVSPTPGTAVYEMAEEGGPETGAGFLLRHDLEEKILKNPRSCSQGSRCLLCALGLVPC